jgi:hypothetical protein
MMASKKTGGRGAGAPRRGGPPSKNKLMPYVVLVGVLVVAAVAGVLIFGSRKPATRSTTTREESRPKRKRARTAARERRSEREDREQSSREQRRERRTRESRSKRGDRSTRKETSSGRRVEAIMTDESGQRYVLIGDRQYKTGDAVSGREIQSISSDQITVEYHGKTYAVRVGQSIY